MTNKEKFYPNCTETVDSLLDYPYLVHDLSNDAHNPKCKALKQFGGCTKEMSIVPDLCRWHYARMAHWTEVTCKCESDNIHAACYGDAIGRSLFRAYYQLHDMPLINMFGELWCCSEADSHSANASRGKCGDMYVCSTHRDTHFKTKLETTPEKSIVQS